MGKKNNLSTAYKRNYMAILAVALFITTVIGQVVIAAAIPLTMRDSSRMAAESRRLSVLKTFDDTRKLCSKAPEKDTAKVERQLLAAQLDRMAIYLRKYSDTLTPDEVNRLEPVINRLFAIAVKMQKGAELTSSRELQISAAVDKNLKESRANAYK